jgi:hypothetical protein
MNQGLLLAASEINVPRILGRAVFAATLVAIVLASHARGVDDQLDFSKGLQSVRASYGRALADATPAQQNILRTQAPLLEKYLIELAQASNPAANEAHAAKRASEELQAVKRMTVRELAIHLLTRRERSLSVAVPEVERFLKGQGLDYDPGAPEYKVRRNGQAVGLSLTAKFMVKNTSKQFKLNVANCILGVGLDDKLLGGMREANLCGSVPVLAPGETATMDVRYEALNPEHASAIANAVETGQRTRVSYAMLPARASFITDGRFTYTLNERAFNEYKAELSQTKSDIALMRQR